MNAFIKLLSQILKILKMNALENNQSIILYSNMFKYFLDYENGISETAPRKEYMCIKVQ